MRQMSFKLTEQQVLDRTKTVTRRLGWMHARVGDLVQPVRKSMGLKRGESIERIGGPIVLLSIRKESLRRLIDDTGYGAAELAAEGFAYLSPTEFVAMFCASHRGCKPDTLVTRVEFRYA
jgi:hypothetical protein